MHYLSACNRGLFKNYYCFVFWPLEKSSSIMKNILIPSLYILEKYFLVENYLQKLIKFML